MEERVRQFYEQIGEKLQLARIRKGWKQQDVADRLGLSRVSVSNIEAAKHSPPLHQYLLLFRMLELDLPEMASLLPFDGPTDAAIPDQIRQAMERVKKKKASQLSGVDEDEEQRRDRNKSY